MENKTLSKSDTTATLEGLESTLFIIGDAAEAGTVATREIASALFCVRQHIRCLINQIAAAATLED